MAYVQNKRIVIAKPCKRLWQSVPFQGELRILSRFAFRMTGLFVIAVRVSGGHLCEAEAPTEPAGETAVRCVAIRLPFKQAL